MISALRDLNVVNGETPREVLRRRLGADVDVATFFEGAVSPRLQMTSLDLFLHIGVIAPTVAANDFESWRGCAGIPGTVPDADHHGEHDDHEQRHFSQCFCRRDELLHPMIRDASFEFCPEPDTRGGNDDANNRIDNLPEINHPEKYATRPSLCQLIWISPLSTYHERRN